MHDFAYIYMSETSCQFDMHDIMAGLLQVGFWSPFQLRPSVVRTNQIN